MHRNADSHCCEVEDLRNGILPLWFFRWRKLHLIHKEAQEDQQHAHIRKPMHFLLSLGASSVLLLNKPPPSFLSTVPVLCCGTRDVGELGSFHPLHHLQIALALAY